MRPHRHERLHRPAERPWGRAIPRGGRLQSGDEQRERFRRDSWDPAVWADHRPGV